MTGSFIFAKQKIGRPGENGGAPDFFGAAKSGELVAVVVPIAAAVTVTIEVAVAAAAAGGFVAAAVLGFAEFVALVFGLAAVEAMMLDGLLEFPFGAGDFPAAFIRAMGGGAGGCGEEQKAGENRRDRKGFPKEFCVENAGCRHCFLPGDCARDGTGGTPVS
jgi:hypothetical protein